MNLKYYLRGLGIGIGVTVFILVILLGGNEAMTDDQVITRAEELGMIIDPLHIDDKENDTAETLEREKKNEIEETISEEELIETEEITSIEEPIETEEIVSKEEPTGAEETASVEEATRTEQVDNPKESGEIKNIRVSSGDGSERISQKLYNEGLIDSASDFNIYLCNNQYDGKLRVGDYKIKVGTTQEQIARTLVGK